MTVASLPKTSAFTAVLVVLLFWAPVSLAEPESERLEHIERMRTFIGLIQDFMNVVDAVHGMTDDPEKAAIYQMHQIEEIYKKKGQTDRAINLFKDILKQTDNQSIRNAAYMRLGDLYKKTNHPKALELYEDALQENIKRAR